MSKSLGGVETSLSSIKIRQVSKEQPQEQTLTMDSLHDFLQKVIDAPVGIRRKLVILYKYVNVHIGTDI